MFVTYILQSLKTNEFYTGSTGDVDLRLTQHQQGLSRSTKHACPWKVVYQEQFPTRAQAMHRERYFKTGKGREELQRLLLSIRP